MNKYTILILLIANLSYSQVIKTEKQIFNYNDNITFEITKMKEKKNGAYGLIPLRGYTSYIFYLKFTNNSNNTDIINIEKIFLANPKNNIKHEIEWNNYEPVGNKTVFTINPKGKRKFTLFYAYEKNKEVFFLVNDILTKIKINEN